MIHAAVEEIVPGTYEVGFEDLFGGGDQDFNDCMVEVVGALSPNPPVPTLPDAFKLGLLVILLTGGFWILRARTT